jgi:hypothetical protein
MHRFCFALLLLAFTASTTIASAPPVERSFSELNSTTKVLLRPSYSSQITWVADPEHVRRLAEEISRLHSRSWAKETVIKHGGCMSQVSFFRQEQLLLRIYVYQDKVFLVPPGRERNPQTFTKVQLNELPHLRAAIVSLNHPASCTR